MSVTVKDMVMITVTPVAAMVIGRVKATVTVMVTVMMMVMVMVICQSQ